MLHFKILNLLAALLAGVLAFSAPTAQDQAAKPALQILPVLDLDAKVPPEEIPALRLKVAFLPQVPPGKWAQTGNCLPACYAMLSAHSNKVRPSAEMIKQFDDWAAANKDRPHNNYSGHRGGYSLDLMVEYAKSRGLITASTSRGNLPILIGLLREGRPVAVSVKKRMDETGEKRHAMVVVGIDSRNVYVNDPGRSAGGNMAYPLEKFLLVWRSGNNRMFHL